MRTFRIVVETVVLTTAMIMTAVVAFAMGYGIIDIQKVEEEHSRIVITDGEVDQTLWNETLGYVITIDAHDITYISTSK